MCCDNKVHRIQHELVLQRGNMRFAAMVGPEKKGSVWPNKKSKHEKKKDVFILSTLNKESVH